MGYVSRNSLVMKNNSNTRCIEKNTKSNYDEYCLPDSVLVQALDKFEKQQKRKKCTIHEKNGENVQSMKNMKKTKKNA